MTTCRVVALRMPLLLKVRIPCTWVSVAYGIMPLVSSAILITIISSITRLIISWSPILNFLSCWCSKAGNASRQTQFETSVSWWWSQTWRHDNCRCLGDGWRRRYPSEQGWYHWRWRDQASWRWLSGYFLGSWNCIRNSSIGGYRFYIW